MQVRRNRLMIYKRKKLKITLQDKNRISSVNFSTSLTFSHEQKEVRKAEVGKKETVLIQFLSKEDNDKKTSFNFHLSWVWVNTWWGPLVIMSLLFNGTAVWASSCLLTRDKLPGNRGLIGWLSAPSGQWRGHATRRRIGGATHNRDEECEKVWCEKQKVARLSLAFFKNNVWRAV